MSKDPGRVIAAATDGACSGNPGPGGWGALIRFEDGSVEEFGGYEPETTNNRMELKAAIEILDKLKPLPLHPDLTIRTDSRYLIDGLNKWIIGWKKKGWITSSGKSVLNQDLWIKLDSAKLPGVSLEYVKAHNGDPDNERVDKIAVGFSKGNSLTLRNDRMTTSTSFTRAPQSLNVKVSEKSSLKNLQKLLSRLEIANVFAKNGYSLTTKELAELVERPINSLEKERNAWQWRDWIVQPIENSYWRLIPTKGITGESKDDD